VLVYDTFVGRHYRLCEKGWKRILRAVDGHLSSILVCFVFVLEMLCC
jgi:hypothetical protein